MSTPINQDRANWLRVAQERDKLQADLTTLRARLETLRTAAKDMLSTYRHDGKTVLVTEERQEAWQKAINESEMT